MCRAALSGAKRSGSGFISKPDERRRSTGGPDGSQRVRSDTCDRTRREMIAPASPNASVSGFEADDNACGLGLVRRQFRQRLVAPIGEVDDHADGRFLRGSLGGLKDVEPAAVEKERMFPEHAGQLRDYRMILGERLGFELLESAFHLCRVQFHARLL